MKAIDPSAAGRNPGADVVARMFGVPVENVRDLYRRNAAQIREMAETARRKGRKVRGYTASQLDYYAKQAETKAGE